MKANNKIPSWERSPLGAEDPTNSSRHNPRAQQKLSLATNFFPFSGFVVSPAVIGTAGAVLLAAAGVGYLLKSALHSGSPKQDEQDPKVTGKDSRGKVGKRKAPPSQFPRTSSTISKLENMGLKVYGCSDILANNFLDTTDMEDKDTTLWNGIAGYEAQKQKVEEAIFLALQRPDIHEQIILGTRHPMLIENSRPRALLFEGPPGTGKTSFARVIAKQAGIPLVYLPIQAVMYKNYGESTRLLGQVFSLANQFPSGAIVFIDEIDSLAARIDESKHHGSRKMLNVLLSEIDGIDQQKRVMVIGATNRKNDLDLAFISRFDSIIYFNLPDEATRAKIVGHYARHLQEPELALFAKVTSGMSGRDIRDLCQQVERHWALKLIKDEECEDFMLPPIDEYVKGAKQRQSGMSHKENGTPSAGLGAMGVKVYGLNDSHTAIMNGMIPCEDDDTSSWNGIAGYEAQKQELEAAIFLALQRPDIHERIILGTRHPMLIENNRPRALLFEGPPGTGKTSFARVIANQVGIPLVYLPIQAVMSKWYGESPRLLGKVFSLANQFPSGAIVFIDEIDSLAARTDESTHDATRKMLNILVSEIDGIDQQKRVMVIGATNKKKELDPALISRFDSIIYFNLPDEPTRAKIVGQYAKHLQEPELTLFAKVTSEMSGRDIRDLCQQVERQWASKLIKDQEPEDFRLPPVEEYVKGAKQRQAGKSHKDCETPAAGLEAMGVKVYGFNEPDVSPMNVTIPWDQIAGYEQQKKEMENTILFALHSPEVYHDIVQGTRQRVESNRARAVLFEGPPGTGKTSCAQVISKQAGVPLIYVPLQAILSKWYAESSRLLGQVFSYANVFPNGAIIFLDEIDSLGSTRDGDVPESSSKLLAVLLQQIDGFEQEKRVMVIGATNRKKDIDSALLSRFDSIIYFNLPDQTTREKIAAQYAKHLKEPELILLATVTAEMSGRDIKDVCRQAEREWASNLIRGQKPVDVKLPPIEEYVKCAKQRRTGKSHKDSEAPAAGLEAIGVKVYGFNELHNAPTNGIISWDQIAGYEQQKQEIEDTILFALHNPDVYHKIVEGTCQKFESNWARGVLFEGPPGTGKTSCARIIAKQTGVPLLYVPLQAILCKGYSESSRLLGQVFTFANEFLNGAIIFLDEIDSLGSSREGHVDETTRKLLAVLLQQIDGFEEGKRVMVIGATNRKQDLDSALLSRFSMIIYFNLPDQPAREKIAAQYAKHLKESELVLFAKATENMSGRDIKDVCQHAGRRWASKLIRSRLYGNVQEGNLPPVELYIKCAEQRRETFLEARYIADTLHS